MVMPPALFFWSLFLFFHQRITSARAAGRTSTRLRVRDLLPPVAPSVVVRAICQKIARDSPYLGNRPCFGLPCLHITLLNVAEGPRLSTSPTLPPPLPPSRSNSEQGRAAHCRRSILCRMLQGATFIPTPFALTDTEVGRAARLITDGPLLFYLLPVPVFISTHISPADTEVGRAARLITAGRRAPMALYLSVDEGYASCTFQRLRCSLHRVQTLRRHPTINESPPFLSRSTFSNEGVASLAYHVANATDAAVVEIKSLARPARK